MFNFAPITKKLTLMAHKIPFKNFSFSNFRKMCDYLDTLHYAKAQLRVDRLGVRSFWAFVEDNYGRPDVVSIEHYEAWKKASTTLKNQKGEAYTARTLEKFDHTIRKFSNYVQASTDLAPITPAQPLSVLATPIDNQGNTWGALIERYFNARALKASSCKIYASVLKNFFENILTYNATLTPTDEILEQWNRVYLQTERTGSASTKMTVIRGFFRWLNAKGLYNVNIDTLHVPRRRDSTHKRENIAPENIRKIFDLAKADSPRNYLMFLLLASCGLRANELVNINVGDIKKGTPFFLLHLLRKNHDDKAEFVTLPELVSAEITNYLKMREKSGETITEDTALFPSGAYNATGQHISTRGLERIANRYFEKIELRSRTGRSPITLHSFRHSCISCACNSGADPLAVQALAGHKNINTTMIYYHDQKKKENTASTKALNYILKAN